jgi:hypothetical protein
MVGSLHSAAAMQCSSSGDMLVQQQHGVGQRCLVPTVGMSSSHAVVLRKMVVRRSMVEAEKRRQWWRSGWKVEVEEEKEQGMGVGAAIGGSVAVETRTQSNEVMGKPTVLVSEKLGDAGIELLRKVANVDCSYNLTQEELISKISLCDALIVRSGTKVTREVFEASNGRLKVGLSFSVSVSLYSFPFLFPLSDENLSCSLCKVLSSACVAFAGFEGTGPHMECCHYCVVLAY